MGLATVLLQVLSALALAYAGSALIWRLKHARRRQPALQAQCIDAASSSQFAAARGLAAEPATAQELEKAAETSRDESDSGQPSGDSTQQEEKRLQQAAGELLRVLQRLKELYAVHDASKSQHNNTQQGANESGTSEDDLVPLAQAIVRAVVHLSFHHPLQVAMALPYAAPLSANSTASSLQTHTPTDDSGAVEMTCLCGGVGRVQAQSALCATSPRAQASVGGALQGRQAQLDFCWLLPPGPQVRDSTAPTSPLTSKHTATRPNKSASVHATHRRYDVSAAASGPAAAAAAAAAGPRPASLSAPGRRPSGISTTTGATDATVVSNGLLTASGSQQQQQGTGQQTQLSNGTVQCSSGGGGLTPETSQTSYGDGSLDGYEGRPTMTAWQAWRAQLSEDLPTPYMSQAGHKDTHTATTATTALLATHTASDTTHTLQQPTLETPTHAETPTASTNIAAISTTNGASKELVGGVVGGVAGEGVLRQAVSASESETQLLQELAVWMGRATRAETQAHAAAVATEGALQQLALLEEALAGCHDQLAVLQSDLDATTSRVHQLTLFIDTATRTVIHWGHRVAHRHRHKPITWLTRQHRQRLAPIAAHAAASLAQKSEMRIGLRVRARNVRRLHRAAEYWTRAVATAVHARGLFALEAGQQGMMISM